MARKDIESITDDIITYLKTVLNDKINAINTDKGDSLLSTVPDGAYYYRKSAPTNKGDDVFVYYEPYESLQLDGQSYRYVKTYQIEFGIAFRNNKRYASTDENNYKRVLRYQKAFEESLVSIFSSVRGYSNVDIVAIQSGSETRDENLIHVSGFILSVTLGG